MKYRLSVTYPVPGQFGMDDMLEERLDALVLERTSDSGSGFGFRDLGWEPLERTAEEMEDLCKAIKQDCAITYPNISATYRESEL